MPPSPGLRGTLRSRAYSFRRVHVTADEVQGAIRSVNNFVLVVRLFRRAVVVFGPSFGWWMGTLPF